MFACIVKETYISRAFAPTYTRLTVTELKKIKAQLEVIVFLNFQINDVLLGRDVELNESFDVVHCYSKLRNYYEKLNVVCYYIIYNRIRRAFSFFVPCHSTIVMNVVYVVFWWVTNQQ